MPIMKDELVHGCGRSFKYPAHYAKHGLKCDGTKPATSGRIAARDGSTSVDQENPRGAVAPRSKKPKGTRAKATARRGTKRAARETKPRPHETSRGERDTKPSAREPATIVTPAAMLEALRAERAKIDEAIRAVEALA